MDKQKVVQHKKFQIDISSHDIGGQVSLDEISSLEYDLCSDDINLSIENNSLDNSGIGSDFPEDSGIY